MLRYHILTYTAQDKFASLPDIWYTHYEVIPVRILCLGDSNTYGYDPRGFFGGRYGADDRWVDILANQTGHICINAGVNGREIPQGTNPISSVREYGTADCILVMLGTNDLLQGSSAKDAAAKMERFLAALQSLDNNILLIAPPPLKRGAWVPTDSLVAESLCLAEEYSLPAKKLNIPFVDTRDWVVELTFDGVHFTEKGHRAFACHIEHFLRTFFLMNPHKRSKIL